MRISDWSSDVCSSDLSAPGERVEEITKWLRDIGAVMLIADPLVELHDASENDNGEMGAVGAILRGIAQQAGCATMVIHHTRKLPAGSSEGHAGNMDSGRGAGAVAGIARVALTLYGMSEKDAKHFGVDAGERAWFVRLDSAKANLRSEEHTPELQSLMRISYAVFCLKKKKIIHKENKKYNSKYHKIQTNT